MAKTTIVTTTDDIDGSKGAQTVAFTFEGTSYEIDLSKKNATALAKALQPYIDAGRKVRGTSGSSRRRPAPAAKAVSRDLAAVRAWAAENGYPVSERGRIAGTVIADYDAAH